MKRKKIFIDNFLIVFVGLLLFSCNDFLDKVPDNRAELVTPKQISQLLVDGYSEGNYAMIAELSGDNFIDNNAPDESGNRYNLTSMERIDDETFAWEDIVSGDQQDSPTSIWEGAYHAIAVANHALEKIAELEKEGRGQEVIAQKGEALLIRAYNHFILVNVFAQTYRNDVLSMNDQGIPYIKEPERTVAVTNERISVTEVYKKIEEDLLAGLPLIDDSDYKVSKYHFNKAAANAFATRFFLYKRDYEKVVEYATKVLGENPALFMRNWNVDLPTYEATVYWMIDAASPNNFLLISTQSIFIRRYSDAYRYECNGQAAQATIFGPGPSWSNYNFHPCYDGKLFISGKQNFGVWFPKSAELFEYTDKTAGIGYPHIIRTEFTGEETLLCRAEAYIHLNLLDKALEDLQIWDKSRQNLTISVTFTPLTENTIKNFYTENRKELTKPLNTEKIDPDWKIDEKQKSMLYCVLHFRRLETIFEGFRWFDIKRYGIEIEHKIGRNRVEFLSWDDPRRAIQLPAEVIAAGMVANVRKKSVPPNTNIVKYTGKLMITN
jgi:hypothetical protein